MTNTDRPRILNSAPWGLALCAIPAIVAVGVVVSVAVSAASISAQTRERPARQCLQEIRQLCPSVGRGDRAGMAACLRERASELSPGCSADLSEQIRSRAAGQGARTQPYIAPARIARTVIYGDDTLQQIDVYEPGDAADNLGAQPPLVLFVHGGGWSMGSHKSVQAKPAHFGASGYYFASAGYRLLPYSPVEEQAHDIAAAIQALRGQAGSIGFDPDRIVLMGHSAGAHLAALVASDPGYLGTEDGAFNAVRGVILLDGAGYDIADILDGARPRQWQLYNNVFGSDPARHAALSPITHAGGADAPNWLALYVEERGESRDQSEALMSKLSQAGANADTSAISATDHGRINREIGTDNGAAQTAAIDDFLARLFERR